ncbi:YidB family protein [Mesorhizobium sp. M0924]|uniref:YidB family protein n=1 Tax=unclassified Mesorhizobium TaxID=325217 RepID=UPI003338888A
MANLGKLAIAMLGVLAYQNRDKIGDMIRGADDRNPNDPQGGILDQLSKGVSGTALGDILDRFRGAGAGSKVDSWVGTGPNEPIQPSEVEAAIDEETLTSLSMQTGLSREELISRITRDLPEAVSKMTPTGELPVEAPKSSGETTLLDDVPSHRTQANSGGQSDI